MITGPSLAARFARATSWLNSRLVIVGMAVAGWVIDTIDATYALTVQQAKSPSAAGANPADGLAFVCYRIERAAKTRCLMSPIYSVANSSLSVGLRPRFQQRQALTIASKRSLQSFAFSGAALCLSHSLPHLRHDLFGQDLQLVERKAVRHARPMHRGADVVDPEPAVEPDHLVGDFGR